MTTLRILGPGDQPELERFLLRYPDTTMFLRGNLRQAGIVDRGEPHQGLFVGAYEAGELAGVAWHGWNGNLLLEAPRGLAEVAGEAVARSGRPVAGILGRWSQVEAARSALGLDDAATELDSREDLFALDLAALRAPALLDRPGVVCRPPREDELLRVAAWRVDYSIEALGSRPSEALERSSRVDIERTQEQGRQWVLEVDGELVSYSAFNAALPDCVQVGGVFTPPRLRSRGYGRAVVAGSLRVARDGGARRSILFTQPDNAPAQAAYRALGYERVGDYGLVLFAEPRRPA